MMTDNEITTTVLHHTLNQSIKDVRKCITEANAWNVNLKGDWSKPSIEVTLRAIDMQLHSAIDDIQAMRNMIKTAGKNIS